MIYQFLNIKKTINNFKKSTFKKRTNPKLIKEFNSFLLYADSKLKDFNLSDWSICFDNAKRRAGACVYNKKELSFSVHFLRNSSQKEVHDTLLHEIAHALVGPKNGHNDIWKKKAMEIGCSAKVYQDYEFSKPKWIKFCSGGCWEQTCFRRKNQLICRSCGSKVSFKTNC